MKKIYLYLILLALCYSCTEKTLEPITPSLGKPGKLTIDSVKNIQGGAIVYYRIPNVEDILSVKAVYTLTNGVKYESSSSFYDNKLTIEGYHDTEKHNALLYVINRAQEMSDPETVEFIPEESSLSKVIKTVDIIGDFGGARFSWVNIDNAALTFEFLAQDSTGRMQTMKVITSQTDSTSQSLRGYEPTPRKFATIISDFWNNVSDTIYPESQFVTPLFEEELDKRKMSIMKLGSLANDDPNSDRNFTNWEGMDNYIIDDDPDNFGHSPSSSLPAPFTVDLGQKAKLSRMIFYQRSDRYFAWGNPKAFTVYTAVERPAQDGNWSSWTKIKDYVIIKPSGTPGTTNTDEDVAAGEAGFEITFPLELEPVRYVRVVILSTWEGTTFSHPAEVTFYGEIVN
jgi:hypothetical protein